MNSFVLRRDTLAFLLSQKSDHRSFNYWKGGSKSAKISNVEVKEIDEIVADIEGNK